MTNILNKKEEELKKLKDTFKSMIIDVVCDLDPTGENVNSIKREKGMGFKKYLEEKTNKFIEKLQDEEIEKSNRKECKGYDGVTGWRDEG